MQQGFGRPPGTEASIDYSSDQTAAQRLTQVGPKEGPECSDRACPVHAACCMQLLRQPPDRVWGCQAASQAQSPCSRLWGPLNLGSVVHTRPSHEPHTSSPEIPVVEYTAYGIIPSSPKDLIC